MHQVQLVKLFATLPKYCNETSKFNKVTEDVLSKEFRRHITRLKTQIHQFLSIVGKTTNYFFQSSLWWIYNYIYTRSIIQSNLKMHNTVERSLSPHTNAIKNTRFFCTILHFISKVFVCTHCKKNLIQRKNNLKQILCLRQCN